MITNSQFVIVDDDEVNNIICRMTIMQEIPNAEVTAFTSAEQGLNYLESMSLGQQIILLLDINMPKVDGWEFMKRFENFPEHIKQQVRVYILSSSIDPHDLEKAKSNKFISDFISKPITDAKMRRALKF